MTDSSGSKSDLRESWIGRGNNALMRGIGTSGVAIIGIACISLSFSGLLPFSHAAGAWPGASLVGVLCIGLILSLVHAYTYAVIGSSVPRSGADYILASRVLNGPAAFVSSWVFVISSGLAAGSLVAFIPKTIFPAFAKVGQVLINDPFMSDLTKTIVQPQFLIIVGTAITLLAFTSMFVSQRTLVRMLAGGLILGIIAWAILFYAFGSASPQSFQAAWDHAMGAGSFDQVIPAAKGLGFDPAAVTPSGPLSASNSLLPAGLVMGFWIFFGAFSSTFFAGEVKKPERSLIRGNWMGLIVVWAILIGATLLVQRVISPQWIAAESYLSQSPAFSGQALPLINYYAAILLPSIPVVIFLLVAWFVMLVNLVQTYILYTSRIMLAWADDGLLPAGMAYVHPRFRSPTVTMLAAAILVQLGLVDSLGAGILSSQANFLYFAVMTMLVPVTAVTFFPFLKKNWFEACPAFVRLKLGPIPLISIFGLITLASLVGLMVSPLLMPGGFAPAGVTGMIVFGGEVVTGLLWYVGRRMALRTQGIKLEEAVKSMPRSS
jgi:basic amino acid/polyamine antiporter, APA family